MDDLLLQRLGCAVETGDDVFGGELLNPWAIGVAIGVTVSICSTIINNWTVAKQSFAAGFSDGSSGRM